MRILYDLIIAAYSLSIRIAAIFGNAKAKSWITGRNNWEENLQEHLTSASNKKKYWFHCASLGEFEQGRALIEKIRAEFPDAYLILSFFSPSGYEIRKDYKLADYVCYLPIDSKANAEKFIRTINPDKSFFVKYEFWYHYFNELKNQNREVYVISAIFRPTQIFFKWYGHLFRNLLAGITQLFVQDENSKKLLDTLPCVKCLVAGDTRFDRVMKVAIDNKEDQKLRSFKGTSHLLIAGSTWPEDEALLLSIFFETKNENYKLVIVPHEVNETHLMAIESKIRNYGSQTVFSRYSAYSPSTECKILIIDTIGLLSGAYSYADVCWVGGGFGKGIHNILEPAAHGKPIIFGPEYRKFREAHELIAKGGAFSVSTETDLKKLIENLFTNDNERKVAGTKSIQYVKNNLGATNLIFDFAFSGKKSS
jgi:3-deoxy-D-manno-octulosonic-acid transferase